MIIKYLGAVFLVVHTYFQRFDVFVELTIDRFRTRQAVTAFSAG